MPDRPDNLRHDEPPGDTSGPTQRVRNIPAHQHLDTDALSAFIDDRLEGDLSLAAAGHIESCADCRRELAELRATVSLLNGLPQYRPRRSFALSPAYARPVRSSRFARFLPLLPRLQAATVACLLLLLVVGAGDVLTQIGEDSNDSAGGSSVPEQTGGDAALESGSAAGGAPQAEGGVIAGDGTGGGTGGGEIIDQAEDSALDEAPAPAGDIPIAGFTAEQSDEESASNRVAASRSTADASEADDEGLGQADQDDLSLAAEDGEDAEAADSVSAGNSTAARAPAADAATEEPQMIAGAGDEQPSAALAATTTTTALGNSEPLPTVEISTVTPGGDTSDEIAQAAASGAAPQGRQSGSATDSGLSNWRLVELVLGSVLILLVVLVFALHRLNARARRFGIIR